MKKILFIILLLITISCETEKDAPKELVTIEMTLITGDKITKTYTLPVMSNFYVDTHRGSYSLKYKSNYCVDCKGTVKNGVIDYEILSKKKYKVE